MPRPSFLMCRPTFYDVRYSINPWMNVRRRPDRALALRQWAALRRRIEKALGAAVHLCRARPELPDMTFAANAGLVHGKLFIPSRFRHRERSGEEPHFTRWFARHGYRVLPVTGGDPFEGAGDVLAAGKRFFAGYWQRSDIATHAFIAEVLRAQVVSLALVDRRFYHLDTCFCPLSPRSAVYYPGAFDGYGVRALKEHFPDLIAVSEKEAFQFGCNLIVVDRKVVVSGPCHGLARALEGRGCAVHPVDVSEFAKAGGGPRCLTLRLT